MYSTENLDDNYLGSGKRLWNSINYHGKENHIKEILEFCETRIELKKREKEIVNRQLINEKLCLNIQIGGGGGFINEEHRKKCSDAGNKTFVKKMKDPKYREEHSRKMSESNKRSFEKGNRDRIYFYEWTGKKHSEETKKKISKSKKGTGKGEKNSQYGKCWINKGSKEKMVQGELLLTYQSKGWVKGRKLNK